MSLSSQAIFGAICVLSIAAETQLLVQTLPHAYGVFDDAMQRHFSDFLAYKPAAAEPCSLLQRLTGACPPPAMAPDMGDARVLAVYSFFWFAVQYALSSITLRVLAGGAKAPRQASAFSSVFNLGSQALQGTRPSVAGALRARGREPRPGLRVALARGSTGAADD